MRAQQAEEEEAARLAESSRTEILDLESQPESAERMTVAAPPPLSISREGDELVQEGTDLEPSQNKKEPRKARKRQRGDLDIVNEPIADELPSRKSQRNLRSRGVANPSSEKEAGGSPASTVVESESHSSVGSLYEYAAEKITLRGRGRSRGRGRGRVEVGAEAEVGL